MNILTVKNHTYNIDCIPDEIDDIRFCVLDCSDPTFIDYYFLPLVFLESFYAPAVVLKLGDNQVQMPLDWSIMISDEEMTDVEVLPLTQLNDRGFHGFIFNPLSDSIPRSEEVSIVNVYSEVKWFFPKLKSGCLLTVPLEPGPAPKCAMFVKEFNKLPKIIDIGDIF